MIDVLGLRVLIALKDTGSVTGAARQLGYTPPNITQHLRRLERRLGSAMVERVGRGIILTERALTLVEQGRPLILELDDLASRTSADPSGDIELAAFPTALRGLVVPAVAALRSVHPELHVRPSELEPPAAADAVRLGRAHGAVLKAWGVQGRATTAAIADLERIPLGVDRVDAILPAGHPLAGERELSLRQLGAESWAVTPQDDPYRVWLAEHRQPLGLDPATTYEAAEFASLLSYVRHGLAVAAVPRLGRGDLPAGVAVVPLTDSTAVRHISLVVRRSSRGGAAVEAVIAQLVATAAVVLGLRSAQTQPADS